MMASGHSKISVYAQIGSDLRDQIYAGKLLPEEKLPTIKQLAKLYAVSPVTASRAVQWLKEQQLVTTTWGGGCFVAKKMPRPPLEEVATLVVSQEYSVDAQIESYWHQIFSQTVLGVQEQTAKMKVRNRNVLIPNSLLIRPQELGEYLCGQQIDCEGALFLWNGTTPEVASRVQSELDCPVVFNDSLFSLLHEYDSIRVDMYSNAANVMHHLCGLGHERIAFLAGEHDGVFYYRHRLRAYREVTFKTAPDDELVYYVDDIHTEMERVCFQLLDQIDEKGITAVFCMNDYRARVLLAAAQQKGILVPEQLAIAGFDGTAEAIEEGVTTVQLPFHYLGREAVLLLEAVVGGSIQRPAHTCLSTGLIAGWTTLGREAHRVKKETYHHQE